MPKEKATVKQNADGDWVVTYPNGYDAIFISKQGAEDHAKYADAKLKEAAKIGQGE